MKVAPEIRKQMQELRNKNPIKYTQSALARVFNVPKLAVARYAADP
jgi:hypothetical protein